MNIVIGTHIGNWKVVSEKFKEDGVFKNTCECICGVIRNVHTWHLNNNKTKGCGCTNIVGRFKSQCVGDLSLSYYNSFKTNREKKGKLFSEEVTMEVLWELFLKQDRKCAISGIEIFLNPQWSQQNNGRSNKIQTASIDRIDSTKNYTIDNIQWVHKDINHMKGVLEEDLFIYYCKQITQNNN